MSTLLEQVGQTIRARGLFRRGQKILVAVSGGVDSMVLLQLLHELSKSQKWQITVAHLNHQLRGRNSDADERLVRRTAKSLRLGVVVGRADVKQRAKTAWLSVEMAAREARHEFLARTAARLKIPTIALAHHADDQIELFFLRVLRGSGGEGLGGMKWKSLSPVRTGKTKIDLVRPLLDKSKESLREYAVLERVAFREDASNASMDILRNRIRHELLPLLRQKYQPAIDRVILRLMDVTSADAEVTHELAEKWLSGKMSRGNRAINLRESFDELPVAIQRRILQLELRRHKITADFALVERLRGYPGKPVMIAPETSVVRDESGKLQVSKTSSGQPSSERAEFKINGSAGRIAFDGRRIQWRVGKEPAFHRPMPRPGGESFDADKVGARVVLRHWQPGDRFQPIGMAQPVKLQDFFTNLRIPRAKRHELIVATTARNEVFWVEGLRISERFKLTSETKRRLMWGWKQG